ncbi:NADH dehydrogenase [ubiquinone] 1 alpha subcomplex assembly factor 2 [Pseudolycoriella hygida]|uniref:NADH dehydrogenase [ubiquinone] 1 alpha subcomplex assembly factor 2 n=1 Tax=Pseudolycoriella hygida TaxID=35572 RepID=A0A9Q0S6A8_9DIPT|nr:NADH dehydrogenase [ubiquinone] 1 alpha subcomplex assembly factor 2 [Pseudolycoriella hygida]
MSKPPPRSVMKMIFTNFINSFRPRQIRGNYMGDDYFGNKYYEIPANPSIGKRKPSRWFEPANKEAFDQERTAEWDAWLRGRRDEPPTKEELSYNLSVIEMKKANAKKIDEKFGTNQKEQNVTGMGYPTYDEYELVPGKKRGEK